MFHLPDLPNAGYSTWKQKQASDAIMTFMREVERDRQRLLTIVVEGPDRWRTVAGQIWRGAGIDTDAIDEIFKYFTLQACAKPSQQQALLAARQNPAKWRELMREIQPDIEAQLENLKLHAKWAP